MKNNKVINKISIEELIKKVHSNYYVSVPLRNYNLREIYILEARLRNTGISHFYKNEKLILTTSCY